MKLEIRRLTGADAEAHAWRYCVLMGQLTDVGCVTDTMRSTYFSLSMDRGVRVFGAFDQGELVGITSLHFLFHLKGVEARIEDVVTYLPRRKQGICTALKLHVDNLLPALSATFDPFKIYKITLQADPSAEGMYEKKFGYRRDETGWRRDPWW
jgi:hypothetical protein